MATKRSRKGRSGNKPGNNKAQKTNQCKGFRYQRPLTRK